MGSIVATLSKGVVWSGGGEAVVIWHLGGWLRFCGGAAGSSCRVVGSSSPALAGWA